MLMTCDTQRLELKILHEDAASLVLSFYEDNKVTFEPWEPKRAENFYTLSYQKASLAAEYQQMLESKFLRYWLFLKDYPDTIIGSVCYYNILKGAYQSCSLGYKMNQQYGQQGFAFESIQKTISIMFQEYHLHRIEAFIMPNNLPSIKLIEKLNFSYEGISYSYASVKGFWTDHKRYSLINPRDL